MELVKHKNCQTNWSMLPVTMLLISVFWFSVMLLCSSLFPFISNISKNYMFLLCNGILVVIVKNSGLMANSHQEMNLMKKEGSYPQKAVEFPAEVKTTVVEDEKVSMEVKEVEPMSLIVVKGGRNSPLITQEGEDDTVTSNEEEEEEVEPMYSIAVKGARNTPLMTPQGEGEEEDDEEGEEVGLLSAEELNKKCDDFIRMMKQQIFEAQQHILVQH